MAKKRKAPRITPEEQARFDENTRKIRARIAEREAAAAEAARKSA